VTYKRVIFAVICVNTVNRQCLQPSWSDGKMVKITVESVDVTQRDGQTKAGKAKPREQTIWVHTLSKDGKPQPHPVRARHTLWEGDQPLPVGTYTLAPQSIFIDRFGGIAVAPKLVSVASGRGGA
jgi:hypothetical protein